jgi:uncharacterized membrane protein
VSILPFFSKKEFFSAKEKEQVVEAIRKAEKETSGEIRVYIENKNYLLDPVERAKEVFINLKMHETVQRNAVLIYIAIKHRELALFADEGIYTAVGKDFWEQAVKEMIHHFKGNNIAKGIENCIEKIGHTLKEKFPYDASTDKNELPDDIVFGD